MTDNFSAYQVGASDPANGGSEIAPNDGVDLAMVSRALWIGAAGDLKVTMCDGSIVTYSNMTVGWAPLRVRRIWATGTTAAGIVSVW